MTVSKKGLRSIVVGERKFHWKFNGKIFVTSDHAKNGFLVVDFGWYDEWLFVNDKENRPPDFEPKLITPKFVSESILFAINEGWNEGKMELEFKNGNFKRKE